MGSLPVNISASRGAAVLGQSEWSTPLKVWMQIMEAREPGFLARKGYVLEPFEESAAMRWGLAFEDDVIRLAEQIHVETINQREAEYSHDDYDFITCHIDGMYEQLKKLHEGKTTNSRTYYNKWGEPGTDHIPRSYQIQVQHQMMCVGVEECIVSVLVFPKMVDEWEEMGLHPYDIPTQMFSMGTAKEPAVFVYEWASVLAKMGFFHQYPVKANSELQSLMLEKYVQFWETNVLGGVAPEPQNMDDIKRLAPEPKGTIIADEQSWRWAKEYKDIGAEVKTANKRKAELKTLIVKDMMGKADVPIDDDSVEKYILVSPDGHKLCSYNGKTFR